MRLGPLPAFLTARNSSPSITSTKHLLEQTKLSSQITHGSPLSVDSAVLLSVYLLGFYHSPHRSAEERKRQVLSPKYHPPGLSGESTGESVSFKTDTVREIWEKASYRERTVGEVKTSGFTIHTLEAALWACWRATSYEHVRAFILVPITYRTPTYTWIRV